MGCLERGKGIKILDVLVIFFVGTDLSREDNARDGALNMGMDLCRLTLSMNEKIAQKGQKDEPAAAARSRVKSVERGEGGLICNALYGTALHSTALA